MGPSSPHSEFIYLVEIGYEVGLALSSLLHIRAFW